jgi:hypothetical protein
VEGLWQAMSKQAYDGTASTNQEERVEAAQKNLKAEGKFSSRTKITVMTIQLDLVSFPKDLE